MKGESGNAKGYAVELCEMWEILNKCMLKYSDCQLVKNKTCS